MEEGCFGWVGFVEEGRIQKHKKESVLSSLRLVCEWLVVNRGQIPRGISFGEILLILRVPLLANDKEVRASALRICRYLLNTQQNIQMFISLGMPIFVIRILDSTNDPHKFDDRIQALKLLRKIISISPSHNQNKNCKIIPKQIVTSLISIINCSSKAVHEKVETKRDRLYRASIEILCELSFVTPNIVIEAGGFRALLDATLDISIIVPQLSESLIMTILHLIQFTPHSPDLHLSYLISPFFDLLPQGRRGFAEEEGSSDGYPYRAATLALCSLLRN